MLREIDGGRGCSFSQSADHSIILSHPFRKKNSAPNYGTAPRIVLVKVSGCGCCCCFLPHIFWSIYCAYHTAAAAAYMVYSISYYHYYYYTTTTIQQYSCIDPCVYRRWPSVFRWGVCCSCCCTPLFFFLLLLLLAVLHSHIILHVLLYL